MIDRAMAGLSVVVGSVSFLPSFVIACLCQGTKAGVEYGMRLTGSERSAEAERLAKIRSIMTRASLAANMSDDRRIKQLREVLSERELQEIYRLAQDPSNQVAF